MYATPRDQVVWLKVQHRTLWTAHVGGMGYTHCSMTGCAHAENQQHLASCPHIVEGFWKPVSILMQRLGLQCELRPKFWITGLIGGKKLDKESAAMVFWAWRALYAQTINAHLNNKHMNLDQAYAYMIALATSRVRAHGRRWRVWYLKQRFIHPQRSKIVAQQYRNYKLFTCDHFADYTVNATLLAERSRTLQQQ